MDGPHSMDQRDRPTRTTKMRAEAVSVVTARYLSNRVEKFPAASHKHHLTNKHTSSKGFLSDCVRTLSVNSLRNYSDYTVYLMILC